MNDGLGALVVTVLISELHIKVQYVTPFEIYHIHGEKHKNNFNIIFLHYAKASFFFCNICIPGRVNVAFGVIGRLTTTGAGGAGAAGVGGDGRTGWGGAAATVAAAAAGVLILTGAAVGLLMAG